LFVADIKASINFFTEKLGFSIAFVYGEPPFYAQVKRDAAQINLRCVDRPVIDPAVRDREELPSAAMTVASTDEITRLFLELQGKNVGERSKSHFSPVAVATTGSSNDRLAYFRNTTPPRSATRVVPAQALCSSGQRVPRRPSVASTQSQTRHRPLRPLLARGSPWRGRILRPKPSRGAALCGESGFSNPSKDRQHENRQR
jgi:catechol 2,3-dioxygenase-like lactoylglutathione lyase family enzyme